MPQSIPFAALNETDVREEIIAPLLRRLDYRSGSHNNIIREQFLRYPKLSLGRKVPHRDPELRGKADYILEVDKRAGYWSSYRTRTQVYSSYYRRRYTLREEQPEFARTQRTSNSYSRRRCRT